MYRDEEIGRDIRASKLVEMCSIPMNWAERTVAKFPDLRDALIVARGYADMPKGRYSNFFEYLNNVQARVLDASTLPLYEQEVQERTAMINPDALIQTGYRDRISSATDYWEQFTSRVLDSNS